METWDMSALAKIWKKYPIRNRDTRKIFINSIQWNNVEFSSNQNND